jgi:hypothetical protein
MNVTSTSNPSPRNPYNWKHRTVVIEDCRYDKFNLVLHYVDKISIVTYERKHGSTRKENRWVEQNFKTSTIYNMSESPCSFFFHNVTILRKRNPKNILWKKKRGIHLVTWGKKAAMKNVLDSTTRKHWGHNGR